MHGHGHPELAKKLNDNIPKLVDDMFERVRAFIQGEVATGSAEMVRPLSGKKETLVWCGPEDKRKPKIEMGQGRRKLAKFIMSFSEPPPLIGTPKKHNLNKLCDYHGDKGHNTNDCYQLKKHIKEAVASRKLAHMVKDIRQGNQRNGSQGRNNVKVINMINGERNHKRPYEGERTSLTKELTFPVILRYSLMDEPIILEGMIKGHQYRASLIGFSGETYHPLGVIDLQITIGKAGRSKTVLMEFAIVKCHSPYNVLIGRTGMKILGAIGLTIHSMIKFSTDQGVVTMETSKKALWEYIQLEKMRNSWKETQWRQHIEQMSRIREQTILRARNNPGRKPGKEPMLPEKERCKGNMGEKKNVDVLAWEGSGGTAVPRKGQSEKSNTLNGSLMQYSSSWQAVLGKCK
ncbi:hypothetical protein Tco_1214814 [Tanacetum coccineum]